MIRAGTIVRVRGYRRKVRVISRLRDGACSIYPKVDNLGWWHVTDLKRVGRKP